MAAITREEAIARLKHEVQTLQGDDLVEVYDELFPEKPAPQKTVHADPAPFMSHVIDHLENGLEVEELVDLWNVVFPKDRNVYFDEETQQLHFNEESGFLEYVE